MKIRLKFPAPLLSDLLAGDHSEEDVESVNKLYELFFHKGKSNYLLVSFDVEREQAKVVLPKQEEK